MKTIFVSVAEFLENGGKLEKGRVIYTNTKPVGEFEEFVDDGVLAVRNNIGSFPLTYHICNVKIEVTPIYK